MAQKKALLPLMATAMWSGTLLSRSCD
jgi:hypothetical protein